ncbi:MAG: MarR family winged helix-turn-helix transcriptional regulator [Thiomonas sp.]
MPKPTAKPAPFLPLLRELVRTYQAFERYSAAHVQSMGLTPAQFDVLATLGNTEGMNPGQLGKKTLITKGTLTGVVDRLLAKGLVQRLPDPSDGRGQIVRLTPEGQTLFERVFPAHGAHLARAFARLDAAQSAAAEQALHTLRVALEQAAAEGGAQ